MPILRINSNVFTDDYPNLDIEQCNQEYQGKSHFPTVKLISAMIIFVNYITNVDACIRASVKSFFLQFSPVACVFLPQQLILLLLPMEATATMATVMRNGTTGFPHLPLPARWRKWVEIRHWLLHSRGTPLPNNNTHNAYCHQHSLTPHRI